MTTVTDDLCVFFGFGSSRWRCRGAQLTSNSKPKLKTLGIFASCPSQDAIILHLRRFSRIDTHRIHVWIFTYTWCFFMLVNVGKYTSPMDPMGYGSGSLSLWKNERFRVAHPGKARTHPKSNSSSVHPGRLIWNLKMMVWKMIFLFNWVIFRFHVNLPGCNVWYFKYTQQKGGWDFWSLKAPGELKKVNFWNIKMLEIKGNDMEY